jgi:gamma-butyrobetaine dioxygenase
MKKAPIATPDFEFYSMNYLLVNASITDNYVGVTWSDGRRSRFHHIWLRDNDASERSVDSVSRERTFLLREVPLDISPLSVSISSQGGLLVDWEDDFQSHYHPGWLRHFDYFNGVRPVDRWEVETWDQNLEEQLPIFSAAAVIDNEDVRYDFLTTIRRKGLAIVTDMAQDIDSFEKISAQIGLLRDMNWGRIFEIKAKPEGEYLAYRGMALEPHNDAPTREYIPGLQVFQCVENTTNGGESYWVDGYYIAEIMRKQYPKEFDILATTPWHYASRTLVSKYCWNTPIFILDSQGNVTTIHDAMPLREPVCVDFNRLPEFFAAYKIYTILKETRQNQVQRKLIKGDVAFVDNRRILHARREFDPTSGKRHIRTAYSERDELLSAIHIIERRRSERDFCE